MTLLQVEGLSVEYPEVGGAVHRAVTDVDLEISAGSIVGLVGESGCGKTTLALAMLGVARGTGQIVGGRVSFEGVDMLPLSESDWAKYRGTQIALVTQNPRGAFNPVERVGDQIMAHYQAHRGGSDEDARARALELLALVGINDPERRMRAFPHELSGGMAQRALIALALSCTPRLLIADEPTSGLDVTIQAEVLDDMRRSAETLGTGMLLITQDLGIVANYCDYVYLMHAGEVVEQAGVERFFDQSIHPATIALLAAQGVGYEHAVVRLRGLPVDARQLPPGCRLHPRCPFADEAAGCNSVRPDLMPRETERHLVRCHRANDIHRLIAEAGTGVLSEQAAMGGVD